MRALGWQDGVAVDAGTAITIDVLRRGRFEGGQILPGFDTLLQALHRRTAQLPPLVLRAPTPLVGRDTAGALRAGAYQTITRGVASTVTALLAALGARARVAVTGGQSEWFADSWPERSLEIPDLMLLGLRSLPPPGPNRKS
jgi:type III pantothenate kinase